MYSFYENKKVLSIKRLINKKEYSFRIFFFCKVTFRLKLKREKEKQLFKLFKWNFN